MKKATILCVLFIGFQSFTYSQAWQKFTNKDFGVSAELPGKFDVKIKNFKERKNLSAVHNGKDYVLFSVSEYDEKINENLAVDLIASSMQEGDEVVQSAKDWKHNGKKWTSAILKSLSSRWLCSCSCFDTWQTCL